MRPSPPHLTAVTACVWLLMVNRQRRADASHTDTVLSFEPGGAREGEGEGRSAGFRDCAGIEKNGAGLSRHDVTL